MSLNPIVFTKQMNSDKVVERFPRWLGQRP